MEKQRVIVFIDSVDAFVDIKCSIQLCIIQHHTYTYIYTMPECIELQVSDEIVLVYSSCSEICMLGMRKVFL